MDKMMKKLDVLTSTLPSLQKENAKLRKALKECWRAAKSDPCAARITDIVISAMSVSAEKPTD
jgi:hypothetical protein